MLRSMIRYSAIGFATAVLLAGCGGGGGGGGHKVLMNGGTGKNGGDGGYPEISAYTGGNLELRRGGSVDTHFNLPEQITPYLGTNPKTVSTSQTWKIDGTDPVLTADEDTILGDDGETEATGLWVKKGVTLTINPNIDYWDCCGGPLNTVELDFSDGVLIEGAVIIGHQDDSAAGDGLGADTANLYFDSPDNILVTRDGSITTSATGSDGASAGWMDLDASNTVINQGTLTANGASGDDGGDGGYIELYGSDYAAFNTGDITNNGGPGTNGTGGDGGGIQIYTDGGCNSCGGVFNSGKLTSRGADGTDGGGDGGEIELYQDSEYGFGSIISSGDWDSSGGNGTSGDANGGDGGELYVYNYGGEVRLSGKWTGRGGNGAGAGNGGDAYSYVDIENYDSDSDIVLDSINGDTLIGVDIDVSGGNTGPDGTGGDAGYLYVYVNLNNYNSEIHGLRNRVMLVGYDEFQFNGGDGTTDGGDAGYGESGCCGSSAYAYNGQAYDENGTGYIGALINEVDWIGNGGNGTAGVGGNSYSGFSVYLENDDYEVSGSIPVDVMYLKNTGKWTLKGGNGKTKAGDGGNVWIGEHLKTDWSGNIDTTAGSCTGGANCPGAYAGEVEIYADEILIHNGDIIADCGNATGTGTAEEWCNDIYLQANKTSHNGTLSSKGGSASTTDNGGSGGYVEILSAKDKSDVNGKVILTNGTNAPADAGIGELWVDGLHLALEADGTFNL